MNQSRSNGRSHQDQSNKFIYRIYNRFIFRIIFPYLTNGENGFVKVAGTSKVTPRSMKHADSEGKEIERYFLRLCT